MRDDRARFSETRQKDPPKRAQLGVEGCQQYVYRVALELPTFLPVE